MPISALPLHLRDIETNFPDDNQYGDSFFGRLYRWYNKKTKTWFAFSYRCTEWWAKWRMTPKIIFVLKGKGPLRWEFVNGGQTINIPSKMKNILWNWTGERVYLSRIQLFCRWHFAIQWPLMFSFHFYPKVKDVPKPDNLKKDLDGKVWFGYWSHFDADLIYWMITSLYFGRNWK